MTFREQEILNMSMSKSTTLNFYISGGDKQLVSRFYYYIHPHERSSDYPFPSNTRGVFYYHRRLDLPPVSGELRFRLCKTLEQFDEGQDLMLRNEPLPWNISIYTLVRDGRWRVLVKLLLQEQLVDEALVQDIKHINMDRPQGQYPWISQLDQPFVIDLAIPNLNIALLSRHDFRLLRFQNIFWDHRKQLNPYTGTFPRTLSFFSFQANHIFLIEVAS